MGSEYELIIKALAGLVIIVLLIGVIKTPPFVGIFIGALLTGLMMGISIEKVLPAFIKGAGEIMGATGLVIALGAMLGGVLTKSGAAECIAKALLDKTPKRYLSWMIALCAMIIGLPLFFEVGLVMMLPIIIAISNRSGVSFVRIAVPALAGMTTLHALVPPHPGPLIAIYELHANLGLTMGLGMMLAIPTVIIAGPLYGYYLSSRQASIGQNISIPFAKSDSSVALPRLSLCIGVVLLPVVLMIVHSYAPILGGKESGFFRVVAFAGEPLIAMLIAVVFGAYVLGKSSKWSLKQTGDVLQDSLPCIASLVLTIGAGGGLKQILLDAHISNAITQVASDSNISLVFLAWSIAVLIRQATGSATVAITTASGIIASLASQVSDIQGTLLVLALGAGSVFFCHINDAGFWMVKSFFALSLKQTLWMWSVLQTIVSLCGLLFCVSIWHFVVA